MLDCARKGNLHSMTSLIDYVFFMFSRVQNIPFNFNFNYRFRVLFNNMHTTHVSKLVLGMAASFKQKIQCFQIAVYNEHKKTYRKVAIVLL